jgi:class 3 adenylate cyclase/energy-coupling factor transporter ATP-binding protein EcfA2
LDVVEAQTAIILVTDLVGSTAIRSEVGEDVAEELRHRHDAVLTEAVTSHGGVVVKSLGDGVLARFAGAASAVIAACVMQREVDGRFDIRIGISAGDVTLENGDCFGAPVIEASRLCDRAEGGQVLASDLVRLLARGRGRHVFEQVGSLELKGVAEPVPASEVVWDESRYDSVRFPVGLRVDGMAFVGRDREMEFVTRCWLEVTAGATKVVLITGEPGIGKTRLVAESAGMVRDRGGAVLHGRCDDEAISDHAAFTEALTPLVADLPDHVIEAHVDAFGDALVGHVPRLASRMPSLKQSGSAVEGSQRGVDEALVDLLRRASEVAPLMLVLEDLHRARVGTAELFRRLVRNSDLGSVLLVGTYNQSEIRREDPIRVTLSDLRRVDGIEHIRLTGLDVDAVAVLVASAHPEKPADLRPALASETHRQTDGNPYFVHEALRQLSDSETAFHLDSSTRIRLGIVGAAGLVVAVVVVAVSLGRGLSVLEWLLVGGFAVFVAASGAWLLAQVASKVTITSDGLTVTATGGVRTTTVLWDEIEAIRWRPPTRWTPDRDGGFFIEATDGRHISNPLIDHPTTEFAQAMYVACRRHHVNDIAIRAKWPKFRSRETAKSDGSPVGQIEERPQGTRSISPSTEYLLNRPIKLGKRWKMDD